MHEKICYFHEEKNKCLSNYCALVMGYLAYPRASGSCIASPFILALSIKVAFNFSNSVHLETQSLIKIYLICYSVIWLIPSKIVIFLFLFTPFESYNEQPITKSVHLKLLCMSSKR